MVFYYYKLPNKSHTERLRLALKLSQALNIPCDFDGEYENDGHSPYIQMEGVGVYIRRITHLTEKEQTELIKKADDLVATEM